MKKYAYFLISGAACLPITYDISRIGIVLLPVLIVFSIACTVAYMTGRSGGVNAIVASVIFALGAASSSVSFYVAADTHSDTQDIVAVSPLWEWGMISITGAATILGTFYLMRNMGRSRQQRDHS
ncbi:MAG: hypothetical protein AAF402_09225 [Pseudomonadota bacterium]